MSREVLNKQAELDQRLRELVEALALATESVREVLTRVHASVLQATAELNQIEMFPSPREVRAACFDCGKKDLEVFHTSKRHGYHLCPDCFGNRERRGMARAVQPDAPALSGARQEHAAGAECGTDAPVQRWPTP